MTDLLWRDLRIAARGLLRAPGFAAAVVLTLALGIGATTALFSVVDAILIRPLPYPQSDRIVQLGVQGRPGWFIRYGGPRQFNLVNPELAQSPVLTSVGVYAGGNLNLDVEPAVRLQAAAVSPAIFDVLGINPLIGRTFTEHDLAGSLQFAVLSERTWRTRFGADPAIVSRVVRLNARAYTVVGVMAARFDFPQGSDVWIPNGADAQILVGSQVGILARLRSDVSVQQARDAIRAVLLSDARHGAAEGVIALSSLRDVLVGHVRPTVIALAAGALLLLLVACANAAHLLLARVAARRREFSVRRAVGASRGLLVQQVLCEGFVLSALASGAAVVAAYWSVDALRALVPDTVYGANTIAVDLGTMFATGALGVLITFGFALGPALSVWQQHALDAMRSGSFATEGPRWRIFRRTLVVAEIAAACVLLSGAVTIVRLIATLTAADTGVANQDAVTFRLTLPVSRYAGLQRAARLEAFRNTIQRIEEEVRQTPNVRSIGVVDQLPGRLDWPVRSIPVLHEQLPQPTDDSDRRAVHLTVSADYFTAAGVRLLAGRPFTAADDRGAYPVSIASASLARALGLQPAELVGARLIVPGTQRPNTWSEVVGVVGDVMLTGPEGTTAPAVYRPLTQSPSPPDEPWFVVDGGSTSGPGLAAIRAAVARVDPALAVSDVKTFEQVRAAALADRRFARTMMSGYGVVSLTLAGLGLYAVVAYFVHRRTREFGIRLALGASPARLRREVVRGGLGLGMLGVAAGGAASFAAARVLWALIPGFGELAPSTVGLVSLTLIVIAAASAWLPARAATRVDPVVALRCE
jgi:putative ABC transport system permease protein